MVLNRTLRSVTEDDEYRFILSVLVLLVVILYRIEETSGNVQNTRLVQSRYLIIIYIERTLLTTVLVATTILR